MYATSHLMFEHVLYAHTWLSALTNMSMEMTQPNEQQILQDRKTLQDINEIKKVNKITC